MQMDGIVNHETEPNHAYRYNEKELDEVSQTYEYGFRYYDPTIGKFTGVDPIADKFAWVSPFNYAENEPIRHIDLHGLQKEDPITGISGAWSNSWIKQQDRKLFESYPKVKPSTTLNRYSRNHPYDNRMLDLGLFNTTRERLYSEKNLEGNASNLTELLELSLLGYNVVNITGKALNAMIADPDFDKKTSGLIKDFKADDRYGKVSFYETGIISVGFGGERGSFNPFDDSFFKTLEVASNELTWMLRNATVKYWLEADSKGRMRSEFRVYDILDLAPGNRSKGYNIITLITGAIYHDMLEGNKNLQTRAKIK